MNSYINKYGKYDYPDDFDKKKTLIELETIRKKIPNKHKKYYNAIIQLIQGNINVPSFDEELDELENEDAYQRNDTKDPELQLKMDIPIMKYVDSVKKQVKTKYNQNPSYKYKLELDKPFEKNENFDNLIKIQKEVDCGRKYNRQINYNNPRPHVYEEYY